MLKRWLFIVLVSLVSITSWVGAEPDPVSTPNSLGSVSPNQRLADQLGQVKTGYVQAGFQAYFLEQSRLWTENYRRRADLDKNLPKIQMELAAQCRVGLLQILELDFSNVPALLMAGNYHFYFRQYPTALWYYRRALELAPNLLQAKLALADFYLERWQPNQVQALLIGESDPEAELRLGEAFLQNGAYRAAGQALSDATPLPPELAFTRDKDLLKISLALGEPAATNYPERYNKNMGLIETTLLTELQGWQAWLSGNTAVATRIWKSGQEVNPDYRSWAGNLAWLYFQQKGIKNNSLTKDLGDAYLNSASKIEQGQACFQGASLDSALQLFLNGIKADHRSLIGFWEAGYTFLSMKDYPKALELLNQGLAVNPNFAPLLQKRADVYRKLGKDTQSLHDQNEALLRMKLGVSTKLTGVIQRSGANTTSIKLQGDLRNICGVWVSTNSGAWSWQPWWGGSITLPNSIKECWVVPVGPGISGEALYLHTESQAVTEY